MGVKGEWMEGDERGVLGDGGVLGRDYGDDASIQPGSLQEVLLHETVVAWVRSREKVTQPKYPWTETEAQYGSRLRGICQYINQNYDVDGLCRALLACAEGSGRPWRSYQPLGRVSVQNRTPAHAYMCVRLQVFQAGNCHY